MEIKATLNWKNQSTKHDGIRIYRSTTEIDTNNLPTPIASLNKETTSYTDSGLSNGVTYHYVIGTYRENNEVFSTEKTITPGVQELGPGSQILTGYNDAYAGFFGEVSPTELITGSALATMVGLTAGTNQPDINTIPWLKFAIDDKILFVSKKPFKYAISWDQINAANIVFGNRVITIGDYQYKIRLMKGIRPDTDGITWNTGYDAEISHGSEWNRLMYNILPESSAGYQASQIGTDWVSYTPAEVSASGNGYYSWCQEQWNTASSRVSRGYASLSRVLYDSSSNTNAAYSWRACLELVTD